ncbi:MAG: amidohydrolase family protein [Planctomycetota bacterium]|nr:amidohydrolase family protein [Planctomycetota bacterium]
MDQRTSSARASGARVPRRSLLGTLLTASVLLGGAVQTAAAQDEAVDEPPAAATPAAPPLAIRAQRVIVRPGHEIENAVVLVRDGRIVAVGEDVLVPEGAETLEGAVVCAGFMDPWSVAGIEPGSARTSSSDASVMAADVIDPYGSEDDLEELVAAGVVATRSQIATRAAVSGIDVVLSTAGANAMIEDAALSTALGVGRGRLDPIDRVGQIDKLVSELTSGAKYGEDVARYERDLAAWQKTIAEKEEELEEDFKKAKKARDKKGADAEETGKEFKEKSYTEDKRPRPPKLDADKAMFARVVNGEIPIVVTVNRALEIRELLRLTRPFTRMRMVMAGGASALTAADDIAARGIPVIVVPTPTSVAGPITELNPGLALAAELHERGVEVLIGSGAGSGLASRDLGLLAALAVGHGLDRDAALHAITHGPARAFDVADHLGSVARGKRAELLLLSGDPLASSTRVLATVSGGGVAYRAEN